MGVYSYDPRFKFFDGHFRLCHVTEFATRHAVRRYITDFAIEAVNTIASIVSIGLTFICTVREVL
jgi:hypothetical protein